MLDELDAGIARRLGAYPTRARRVLVLRALQAVIDDRSPEARRYATAALSEGGRADETGRLAEVLATVARARAGESVAGGPPLTGDRSAPSIRELAYWRAYALHAAGQHGGAARELDMMLRAPSPAGGVELEWRVAALLAAARRAMGARDEARAAAERASLALAALRRAWAADAAAYRTAAGSFPVDCTPRVRERHRPASPRRIPMSLFEISRDGFAVVGLLGGLVLLYQRLFAKKLDEDAPIRVKGGSVSIESEKEWEDDTSDDDDRDYFSRGRVNRLAVRVGTLAQPGTDVHTGNKVVVTVQNGEDEQDTYKFRDPWQRSGPGRGQAEEVCRQERQQDDPRGPWAADMDQARCRQAGQG